MRAIWAETYPENDSRVRAELNTGEKTYKARFLMEEFLGHQLSEDQVVHHKDEDSGNDWLYNLEVMTFEEHMQMHRDGIMISPWKRKRIIKMANEMDELDLNFLSVFAGEPFEEVAKLFSHVPDYELS